MKKVFLSAIFLLAYLLGSAQIVNHPQSFDEYGWGEKNDNNIILSAGKYTESYIINYNLSNGAFSYLNDSTTLRFSNFKMIGDTGIATTGTGIVYYTHNNWKNFYQSTVSFESTIKTNTGFLGRKTISNSAAEYYHSVDGNTWVLVKSANKGALAYKDGKTWLASKPSEFNISYDGGLTYTTKQNLSLPQVTISDFIPFDTLKGIAIIGTSTWYYTKDGGTSWTLFNGFPSIATFVYASNLDTIYANFTSTGVNMTVDTGNTWQPVSIDLPANTGSRMHPVGNYLVSQNSGLYSSQGIGLPWVQLHKRLGGGTDVSFYNNKGIIITGNGNYYYSYDKGKTYYMGETNLGSGDLRACEMINDSIILVGDRQSNIWVSKNGGATWNKNYSNSQNWISRKFKASADLATMVLFRNGQNVISTDQGLSWNFVGSIGGSFDGTVTPLGKLLIVSGSNILEMNKSNGSTSIIKTFTEPNVQGVILEMVDDNIGYAIAINTTDNTTVIFKTTDGWANYTKTGTINTVLTITPNPILPSLTVAQNLALNIVGTDTLYVNRYNVTNAEYSSNVIYKSFNGGATWVTDSIVPYKQGGATDKLQNLHYFAAETFTSAWGERIVQNNLGESSVATAIEEKGINNLHYQSVLVFPNPTINSVNLQSKETIEQIILMDICGKLILSEQTKTADYQLNISDLPSGIYFLRIKTSKTIETKKIVKQN